MPQSSAMPPSLHAVADDPETPEALRRHPRLLDLVERARAQTERSPATLALVHPCDALALQAAHTIGSERIARPLLVGNVQLIEQAAAQAQVDCGDFEIVDTPAEPAAAAHRAVELAREGRAHALMKGSLHSDVLLSAVVDHEHGLAGSTRISHCFVFDLPCYHKLLALADCVVNIAPDGHTKADILSNALDMLRRLGVARPKAAVLAAVETVNPAIPATVDGRELALLAARGRFGEALVEGPLGFDDAFSLQAARIKHIATQAAGDFDLLLAPDLNSGNMLYKSFVYVGGGECAGIVLGARVPVVLTSRADSLSARLASVALAVLASRAKQPA